MMGISLAYPCSMMNISCLMAKFPKLLNETTGRGVGRSYARFNSQRAGFVTWFFPEEAQNAARTRPRRRGLCNLPKVVIHILVNRSLISGISAIGQLMGVNSGTLL